MASTKRYAKRVNSRDGIHQLWAQREDGRYINPKTGEICQDKELCFLHERLAEAQADGVQGPPKSTLLALSAAKA